MADVVLGTGRLLLERARGFETEVLESGEPESLHQYRVSLRQLRSVLGQFKRELPSDCIRVLRSELRTMATRTNALRDSDVMIASGAAHRALVAPPLRSGLDLVQRDLRRRRGIELRRVRRWLRSSDYAVHVEACEEALDGLRSVDRDLKPVLRRAVDRSRSRIRKRAARLGAEAPDREIHRLRIECKKLRYLVALFGENLPGRSCKAMVRELKRAQQALGAFNDLAVQQRMLADYLAAGDLDAVRAAAAGGLISVLYATQVDARQRIVRRCRRLAVG